MPLVFSWKKVKPFCLPSHIISGRSSRRVGSPPDSCMLKGPPCAMRKSYCRSISSIFGSSPHFPADA